MNIKEIATATVDRLEPSLKRGIDSHATSTHPEIVNGRNVMINKRERMIEIVELAISDAIVAARLNGEIHAEKLAIAASDMMAHHCPQTEDDMREALKVWKEWKRAIHCENTTSQATRLG